MGVRGFAALPVLGLLSCGRPADLGDWRACWMDGAVLVHEGSPPRTRVDPGPGAVLELRAKWGEVPFMTDAGSQAELSLGLPLMPAAGDTLSLATTPALFLEGGQIDVFVSRTVSGTATIQAVDPTSVTVRIDGRAMGPSLDAEGMGGVDLRGTVVAPRTTDRRCP